MLPGSPALSRLTRMLVATIVLVTVCGCVTSYRIRMRGVQPEPERTIAASSRVAVEKVPEITETERDPIIRDKLVHLLEERGFEVVDLADADYVLLYNTETTPVAARSSFGAATSGKGGMRITANPGPFERSVRLHILEAEPYRRDGTEEVIWSCHTVMPEVPNSSPRFEDLLLAGTFKHFPEETGAVVTWKMSLHDEDAKELHRLDPLTHQ